MYAAQSRNTNKHPMYGCYVVGRNWFFVVLEGKDYAVSDAFVSTVSTQEDVFQILAKLHQAKAYIEKTLAARVSAATP